MVVLAIGWLIIVAFVVMSLRISLSSQRVDDEKKVWSSLVFLCNFC